jgi:hypothetical protein
VASCGRKGSMKVSKKRIIVVTSREKTTQMGRGEVLVTLPSAASQRFPVREGRREGVRSSFGRSRTARERTRYRRADDGDDLHSSPPSSGCGLQRLDSQPSGHASIDPLKPVVCDNLKAWRNPPGPVAILQRPRSPREHGGVGVIVRATVERRRAGPSVCRRPDRGPIVAS